MIEVFKYYSLSKNSLSPCFIGTGTVCAVYVRERHNKYLNNDSADVNGYASMLGKAKWSTVPDWQIEYWTELRVRNRCEWNPHCVV